MKKTATSAATTKIEELRGNWRLSVRVTVASMASRTEIAGWRSPRHPRRSTAAVRPCSAIVADVRLSRRRQRRPLRCRAATGHSAGPRLFRLPAKQVDDAVERELADLGTKHRANRCRQPVGDRGDVFATHLGGGNDVAVGHQIGNQLIGSESHGAVEFFASGTMQAK